MFLFSIFTSHSTDGDIVSPNDLLRSTNHLISNRNTSDFIVIRQYLQVLCFKTVWLPLSYQVTQVITGQSPLNSYLYQINKVKSPLCTCSEDIETVEHIYLPILWHPSLQVQKLLVKVPPVGPAALSPVLKVTWWYMTVTWSAVTPIVGLRV